jgi:hypothetical protein
MLTLFTILLVILGIIISANMKNHRMTTLLVVLLFVLIICYVRYMLHKKNEGFSSNYYFAPLDYTMSGGCSGMQSPSSNLVYPSMGPMAWDGLVLKSTPKEEKPLLSDVTIFSPVGDGIRLTEGLDSQNFPTVDGKPDSPHHLFLLAHNQVSADCCPSTFSDSRGCVCLTKEQRDMINKRLGNRSSDLYPNI